MLHRQHEKGIGSPGKETDGGKIREALPTEIGVGQHNDEKDTVESGRTTAEQGNTSENATIRQLGRLLFLGVPRCRSRS